MTQLLDWIWAVHYTQQQHQSINAINCSYSSYDMQCRLGLSSCVYHSQASSKIMVMVTTKAMVISPPVEQGVGMGCCHKQGHTASICPDEKKCTWQSASSQHNTMSNFSSWYTGFPWDSSGSGINSKQPHPCHNHGHYLHCRILSHNPFGWSASLNQKRRAAIQLHQRLSEA